MIIRTRLSTKLTPRVRISRVLALVHWYTLYKSYCLVPRYTTDLAKSTSSLGRVFSGCSTSVQYSSRVTSTTTYYIITMELAAFTPKCVFITGTNRGIGLELVKQFLALPTPPQHLFATYRNPEQAKELCELAASNANLHAIQFDVTDYAALPGVVKVIQDKTDSVNLLINNAGYLTRSLKCTDVTPEEMRTSFEINTIAPLMITKEFLPLLKKAASSSSEEGLSCRRSAVVNVSTKVASIADNGSGRLYGYRASKIALNMVTTNLSQELRADGIMSSLIHPGWVQTDMGGASALIDTAQCVRGMVTVMAGLTDKDNGQFYDYKGEQIPW